MAGMVPGGQRNASARRCGVPDRAPTDAPVLSSDSRVVPLPAAACDELRVWLSAQTEYRLAQGPAWNEVGRVIPKKDGTQMAPSTLKSQWWNWVARQGIDPHLPIHGLRDSFGTWVYETYGVKQAQERLRALRPGEHAAALRAPDHGGASEGRGRARRGHPGRSRGRRATRVRGRAARARQRRSARQPPPPPPPPIVLVAGPCERITGSLSPRLQLPCWRSRSERDGRLNDVDSSLQPAESRSSHALLASSLGAVCALGAVATDLYLPGVPSVVADLAQPLDPAYADDVPRGAGGRAAAHRPGQ